MKKVRESVAFKSISGIVLLLTVFAAIVCTIGYKGFTKVLLEQYAERAFQTAQTAGDMVDPDRIEAFIETQGTSDEYVTLWKKIDQLCNSTGSTFIYAIQPDRTDYGHITFVLSTINKNSTYDYYGFGYVKETTNEDYRQKYIQLYNGTSEQALVIRDKGYIQTDPHITAMIPLKGKDGQTKAILCVQRQMDALAKARHDYIHRVTLVLILLTVLVIIGQGLYLHKVLILPVKQITREAMRFAEESVVLDRKLTDTIRYRDEIGLLAGSIDQMEEQIHDYVENLTRITAEKERIGTELSLATRIQADMLPNTFPAFPDRKEFDIYASMDPAKEVGGDFYDFFLIDEDHLGLVIADVSGKGVPAALFMMASRIIIANSAILGESPGRVLENANNAICSNNPEEMFVTVWLGILEISTGKLTAANAGHEYPAMMQPGGSFEVFKDKHDLPVGVIGDVKYREYVLELKPGTKLYLYTDGVAEAVNGAEDRFGTDRMLAVLNRNKQADPQAMIIKVKKEIDDFAGEADQFDDITMLCLEYRGAETMLK
ncbi:MAG: SpoIIE family protein phosphatase [Lachnospiraceae bacterium]|nr:SpoIIE family protein phosphatase [Lachnospiraceae bacterium]